MALRLDYPLMAAVYEAEWRRRSAVPLEGGYAATLLDVAGVASVALDAEHLFDRLATVRLSSVARRVPLLGERGVTLGALLGALEAGGGAAFLGESLMGFEDLLDVLRPIAPPVPVGALAAEAPRVEPGAKLSDALLRLRLSRGTPLLVGGDVVTLRSALCGFLGQCMERGTRVPFDAHSYSVPAPELEASEPLPRALSLLERYEVVLVEGRVLGTREACSIIGRPGAGLLQSRSGSLPPEPL